MEFLHQLAQGIAGAVRVALAALLLPRVNNLAGGVVGEGEKRGNDDGRIFSLGYKLRNGYA